MTVTWSCKPVTVYEKQVDLPQHEWRSNQHVVIPHTIQDSLPVQLFFVMRHTERFAFDRLAVRLFVEDTSRRIIRAMQISAPLTDSSRNWNGTMMDDLYYNRIKINPAIVLPPGPYRFVLQHNMKEQTVGELLNVGIALNQ